MAAIFNSTVGGTSSNSYVSVSDADDYFTFHLDGEKWKIPTIRKQAALVQATRRIDRERFSGQKTTVVQSLQWPRINVLSRTSLFVVDAINTFNDGRVFVPADIIPNELIAATCELALHYLKKADGEYIVSDDDAERVSQLSVGPLNMTIRERKDDELPGKVKDLLNSIGERAWLGNPGLRYIA